MSSRPLPVFPPAADIPVHCPGCEFGCHVCRGLLMRRPAHHPACVKLGNEYRSAASRECHRFEVTFPDLRDASVSCPDCRMLVQILDHFPAASESPSEDPITLWFEERQPFTVTVLFRAVEVMLNHPISSETSLQWIGPGPQVALHPLDNIVLAQIRGWLRNCTENHDQCSPPPDLKLPARLLQIVAPVQLRLVDTQTTCQRLRYAALSHVWGSEQPLVTTKATLPMHKQRITLSALTQTFRDAVDVCQALDIRYLWIDSLCIVQDDPADWQVQSSCMADIYGGGFVTIAAHAATNDRSGFLATRDSIQFPYSSDDGLQFELSARKVADHPTTNARNPPPLLTRAWVYQERLLSPRIIHFNPEEVVFECSTTCECECGRFPRKPPRSIKHLFADASVIELYDRSLPATVEQWFRIVESYTSLDITYPTDRLPALSGIASRLQSAGLGEYRAGLWSSHFTYFLLWTHTASWNSYSRPPTYTAPSWSWASLCGSVTWSHVRGREWEDDEQTPLEVKRVTCIPKGLDPRGELMQAEMLVRGEVSDVLIKQVSESPWDWDLEIRGGGELYLDLPHGSETSSGATVRLLTVSKNLQGIRRKSLVLVPVLEKYAYRRIGLFGHWDWDKQDLPETWWMDEITVV